MEKQEMGSMTVEELQTYMKTLGEPSFRAKQVFEWIHQKHAGDFDEMTNLSKKLREKLKEGATLRAMEIAEKYVSAEDETTKYLFVLSDHNIIESVLMRYSYGNTVCISSQVGCRMGCGFCASTLGGLVRNLTAYEMVQQIYQIQKDCGERVGNVVVMGTGEPLDNYEEILRFIRLLNAPEGIQIGQRHITISTCGLVDKIYQLAEEKLQITLAISLHGPNDTIRKKTMPIAKKYAVEETLKACQHYVQATGRRITFEYALIRGVNDQKEHAEELAKRLKKLQCHVNLIPVNEVEETGYEKSQEEAVRKFATILQGRGIETTIRRKLGADIEAACGQLRRSYIKRSEDV